MGDGNPLALPLLKTRAFAVCAVLIYSRISVPALHLLSPPPPAYAARPPSSCSAVITYVPDFWSRSSVTIFCFSASSRSFEKVENP